MTRRTIAGVTVVAALFMLPSVLIFGPRAAPSSTGWVVGADRLPPPAPEGAVPRTTDYTHRTGLDAECGAQDGWATCVFDFGPARGAADVLARNLSDLRAEVWLGVGYPWVGGVDDHARGPILVAPVEVRPTALRTVIDIGPRRDGTAWWIVPTAVFPDGVRYRLSDGEGVALPFNGTIADWLNAPG